MGDKLTLTGQNALDLSGFDSGDKIVLTIHGKIGTWTEDEDDDGKKYSITIEVKSTEPQDVKNFNDAARRSAREIKFVPRIEPQVG